MSLDLGCECRWMLIIMDKTITKIHYKIKVGDTRHMYTTESRPISVRRTNAAKLTEKLHRSKTSLLGWSNCHGKFSGGEVALTYQS
jgi:hypothetical protein